MEVSKFPLDIFPNELKELIEELKRTNNFAEEFTAMGILYTVGLAVGNTMHVEAKKTWNINVAIWILFVARSGLGKSPPMKWLLSPIRQEDKVLNREFKELLKEFEEYEALSKEEKENRELVQEPKKLKHLYKDFTPERLVQCLDNNKRGIGVHSPEFKEVFNNLERYSRNGALQMLLSWFDQEEHPKETMSISIDILMPFFSLSGGITTKAFKEFRHSKLSGVGFFERMLVIHLPHLKAEDNDEDIDDKYIKNWSDFIQMILSYGQELDEFGEPEPKIMKYTDAAKVRLKEWYTVNNSKINNECEEYATIYSKQKTYLHKFSGLFNIISVHCQSEQKERLGQIGNYSLERAIKLVAYFENKHKEIIGVGIKNEIKRLLKDEDKVDWYNSLDKEFTTHRAMELFDEKKFKERKDTDRTVYRMLEKEELFKKLYETHWRKVY